jgi:Acetyltransferases
VQNVEVLERYRGQGIGTALIAAAEREAAARGFDRLTLTVSTGKPDVQALYERLGFRDAGLPPSASPARCRSAPARSRSTTR